MPIKSFGAVLWVRKASATRSRQEPKIYGVEAKVFNQTIKRNEERFPEAFRFQLTIDEYSALRSQSVTLNDQEVKS